MYKLHFPLGWFRAVCVRNSCQPSLTKLFLSLSTSRSSFYSILFSSVSPTLSGFMCVSGVGMDLSVLAAASGCTTVTLT